MFESIIVYYVQERKKKKEYKSKNMPVEKLKHSVLAMLYRYVGSMEIIGEF